MNNGILLRSRFLNSPGRMHPKQIAKVIKYIPNECLWASLRDIKKSKKKILVENLFLEGGGEEMALCILQNSNW